MLAPLEAKRVIPIGEIVHGGKVDNSLSINEHEDHKDAKKRVDFRVELQIINHAKRVGCCCSKGNRRKNCLQCCISVNILVIAMSDI